MTTKHYLQEKAQLHAAAVSEVVLRVQRLVHGTHAQREGGARQRRHLRRAHDALAARCAAIAVVGTQVPAQLVHTFADAQHLEKVKESGLQSARLLVSAVETGARCSRRFR